MDETLRRRYLYPLLAPLSGPMIEHLAKHLSQRLERKKRIVEESQEGFLLQEVQEKRSSFFHDVDPQMQLNQQDYESKKTKFSTAWLSRILTLHTPGDEPVARSTISQWKARGCLRFIGHGEPELDSAAALCIVRMIDNSDRLGLPTMSREEPYWWCWRQDGPDMDRCPCPIPLPSDLASTTLLWTSWPGASWNNEWLPIGNRGAIRWAHTKKVGRHVRWSISLDELKQWEPEVARLILQRTGRGTARDIYQELLQTGADFILRLRALSRFDLSDTFLEGRTPKET